MENNNGALETKHTTKSTPPPPPPPPLPPPSPFQKSSKPRELKINKASVAESNSYEQTSLLKHTFCDTNSNIISYNKPIHSIIQEGPSCGIVALSMASQFFESIEVHDIFSNAKALNFTKSGEIFSAYNMATLATSLFNCDTNVIENLKNNKNLILTAICRGRPVLIPYDADKNHSPCLNNGKTAHWAVLSGLCFSLAKDHQLNFNLKFETLFGSFEVLCVDESNCTSVIELLKYASKIYVYAKQGKSRHLALWDLDLLLQSNSNLYEITQKYGIDKLIFPKTDALSELRDKAVIL